MIDYESFKNYVIDNFADSLPAEYQDAHIDIQESIKINKIKDGLVLHVPGKNILPVIYINDMYDDYSNGYSIQEVVKHYADVYIDGIKSVSNDILEVDYKKINTDSIIFQVINTEQNETLLQNVPHRNYLDLSIIYRVIIGSEDTASGSYIITNSLAQLYNLTEEQLFEEAIKNNNKPIVKPIGDIINEHFFDDFLLVITNERRMYGASQILNEQNLYDIATRLDSNLYILPSSVHEILVIPSVKTTPNDLFLFKNIVKEVNLNTVSIESRLSDNVYFYNRELREVYISNETLRDNMMKTKDASPDKKMNF